MQLIVPSVVGILPVNLNPMRDKPDTTPLLQKTPTLYKGLNNLISIKQQYICYLPNVKYFLYIQQ